MENKWWCSAGIERLDDLYWSIFLRDVAIHHQLHQEIVAANGVEDILLASMENHTQVASIQRSAYLLLQMMCYEMQIEDNLANLLVSPRPVGLLLGAVASHRAHDDIARSALRVLVRIETMANSRGLLVPFIQSLVGGGGIDRLFAVISASNNYLVITRVLHLLCLCLGHNNGLHLRPIDGRTCEEWRRIIEESISTNPLYERAARDVLAAIDRQPFDRLPFE